MVRSLACAALFMIACAANPSADTDAPPRGNVLFPPLPDSVISRGGWTIVHRPHRPLDCGGVDAIGCFMYPTRELSVVQELSPKEAFAVLEHEKIHMVMNDARLLHVGTEAQQDSLADAIAQLRVLERLVPGRCR